MRATSSAPISKMLRQENSPSHPTPAASPLLASHHASFERLALVWGLPKQRQQHVTIPPRDRSQRKSRHRETHLALHLEDNTTETSTSLRSSGPHAGAPSRPRGRRTAPGLTHWLSAAPSASAGQQHKLSPLRPREDKESGPSLLVGFVGANLIKQLAPLPLALPGNAVWRLQHGEIVVDEVLSASVKLSRDLKESRAEGRFSFYSPLEEPESLWHVAFEK